MPLVKSVARFLLIALLLVATPLRGYAAAAMIGCAGHAGGETALHEHGPRSNAGGHEHHVHADAHASSHADQHDHDHSTHSPSSGSCSACGACCVGAALTASSPVLAVTAARSSPIPFHPQSFRGVVLEVFDPPPLPLV
jgi:hypothetical protein